MSKTSPGFSKRFGMGLVAAAVSVLGLAHATPAGAVADVNTEDRAAGATRYGTAADAAVTGYPDGSDTVIIATGEKFADALAASGLAGALDAPVLLTQKDTLPAETLAGIEELGATNATIIGGPGAVSAAVQDALEDEGLTVDRIQGENRYETAAMVADAIGDYDRAIVASGEVAADALAAGPIAADQEDGPSPILLVTADEVPEATADALAGVSEVLVVGGTARVSADTEAAVEAASGDADAERIAGTTRQETAALVAEWTVDNLGWAPTTVLLAAPNSPSNDFSPDALVGGPLGAVLDAPVLILQACADVSDAGTDFLTAHADTIASIIPIGGTAVICEEAVEAAASAAGDLGDRETNQSISVAGTEAAENNVGETRQYTVSDLDDEVTYTIALFPSDSITDTDGIITFGDEDEDGEADDIEGVEDARVVVANGAPVAGGAGDSLVSVEPVNGTITFTVTSDVAERVTPVVFVDDEGDGDGDELLAIDEETLEPTEPFGVGGEKRFLPAEAGLGTSDCGRVVEVDKDADSYHLDTDGDGFAEFLVNYASGDSFEYDGDLAITLAQFDAWLSATEFDAFADTAGPSPGDEVCFEGYNPGTTFHEFSDNIDDALPATDLVGDVPAAPTGVSASWRSSDELVRVSWTEPTNPGTAVYMAVRVELVDGELDADTVQFPACVAVNAVEPSTADNSCDDATVEEGATYVYIMLAMNADNERSPVSGPAIVTIPRTSPEDTTAPKINTTVLTDDNGDAGLIDSGDVIEFQFNESMNTTIDANGSAFRFTDPDGTVWQITCGTNATCALSDGDANGDDDDDDAIDENSLLTVTLTGAPVRVGGPTDNADAEVPGTVTLVSSHWDDEAGNQLDLAGSTDKVIDPEIG